MRDDAHRAAVMAMPLLLLSACSSPSPSPSEAASTSEPGTKTATSSSGTTGAALEGKVQLVDVAAFEQTPAEDDPYADRPADAGPCEFGFGLENGLFEIQTDLCGYAAFSQPSLAPIRAGDTVEFLLIHDALYAKEAGVSAHLSVAIGETIVWETSIPFPAEPGVVRPAWTSTLDAPEGTAVHLHIHNHGVNNYRFAAMTVEYAD